MGKNNIEKAPPFHIELLKKHLTKFKAWLIENGSVIHDNTNAFEVLRFEGNGHVVILYVKSNGTITWSDTAKAAWKAFITRDPAWKAQQKQKRSKSTRRRESNKNTLLKRDGPYCVYCGKRFDPMDLTIEHLIALSRGGPDTIENMVLACKRHNTLVGNFCLTRKIRMAAMRCQEFQLP